MSFIVLQNKISVRNFVLNDDWTILSNIVSQIFFYKNYKLETTIYMYSWLPKYLNTFLKQF